MKVCSTSSASGASEDAKELRGAPRSGAAALGRSPPASPAHSSGRRLWGVRPFSLGRPKTILLTRAKGGSLNQGLPPAPSSLPARTPDTKSDVRGWGAASSDGPGSKRRGEQIKPKPKLKPRGNANPKVNITKFNKAQPLPRGTPRAAAGSPPSAPRPPRRSSATPLGCHNLSDATCLIRPHLFYTQFIVSRITIICQTIHHV